MLSFQCNNQHLSSVSCTHTKESPSNSGIYGNPSPPQRNEVTSQLEHSCHLKETTKMTQLV